MFEQLKLQRDEPWFKLKVILSAIAIGLGGPPIQAPSDDKRPPFAPRPDGLGSVLRRSRRTWVKRKRYQAK
jgi:hypothetical protein